MKKLWNKKVIAGIIIIILTALGITMQPEIVDKLVCMLPGIEGCM